MSDNCCGCELVVECVPVYGDLVLGGVVHKVEKVVNVKVKSNRMSPWSWCVVGVCGDVATTLSRDDTGLSPKFYLETVKRVVRHHNEVVQVTKQHRQHIDPEVLSHVLTYSVRCVLPHVSWFNLPLYYHVKAKGCVWSFGCWPWGVTQRFHTWVGQLEEDVLCLPTPCYLVQEVLDKLNPGGQAAPHFPDQPDHLVQGVNHPVVVAQTGQVVAP